MKMKTGMEEELLKNNAIKCKKAQRYFCPQCDL